MKEKSQRHENNRAVKESIAIVGIGCRFPGEVNSPTEFWEKLKGGLDAITDVPADRWQLEEYYDPDTNKAGKIKSAKGGFIKDIDKFDAEFFSIFPAEAQCIDPQQRMLLEVTYQALEDAGIPLEKLSGSKTAVFMGVFMNDYWDIQASGLHRDHISPHVPMGVSLTSIANRLSYVYNLKGPSVTLDTACSSSLVGVHLACRSIWSGESQMALAGGVNLILRPESSIMMSKGNFLSPDGYCKTFDSRANGYVRSEGTGVIVLKPLSQAEADGDHIHAIIRGTAVNQDGHTEEGFTVPSVDAQVEMLRTAYADAGVDPALVSYVEAHGTGTPVGDPIETNAFSQVLGKDRSADNPCLIGSVKSNIGHLEAAAGIAGLVKLAMVLQNKAVPGNLHFRNPNRKIPFEQYKLKVVDSFMPLPETRKPLIGGVNSFGAGGTNAHVVMEAYVPAASKQKAAAKDKGVDTELFLLSARSLTALKAQAQQYTGVLSNTSDTLKDICFSLANRRSAHEHRLSIACRSKEALTEALQAFLNEETRPGMSYQKARARSPKIGFIYSGQGPQWFAMGQQLLKTSPLFRETILKIETLFSKVADWSLLEEMSKNEAESRVNDTRIAQPAIMAIQIALTEMWKSFGIQPAGVVGHSIGEVAAAYAAGSLTLEQAVEVIYHRSRGQNKASGKGKMLAIGLPLEAVKREIIGLEAQISIGAINGPQMVVLSGDTDALELVAARLEKKEVFNRFVKVTVPFHSHHMDPLKEELTDSLKHLQTSKGVLPIYSTVTGKREDGTHLDTGYWFRNVREPVYFTDAIQSMIDDGFEQFIEIAPHPILTSGAQEMMVINGIKDGLIAPSLRRQEDEAITLTGSLGWLWSHGYPLTAAHFFAAGNHIKLPAYPWQKQSYWFETDGHRQKRLGVKLHPYLESYKKGITDANYFIWDINLDKAVHPYLEDHKVHGTIVFPGTGHLELAQAVARASYPESFGFLEDVHFEAALFLPDEGLSPEIRLEIASDEGSYTLYSKPYGSDENSWSKHSRGKINFLGDEFASAEVSLEELRGRISKVKSVADLYLELKECGLQYGEAFRCIQKLWTGEGEILAALSLPENVTYGVERFQFHPALLDACLHTLFAAKEGNTEEKRGIYLPVGIRRFKMHQKPGKRVWAYIQVEEASDAYLRGNYWIMNEDGSLVAEIQGLSCKYIEGSRGEQKNDLYKGLYEYQWESYAEAFAENADPAAHYLIFADESGVNEQVVALLQQHGIEPTVVKKNSHYERSSNHYYKVNPASEANIRGLLAEVLRPNTCLLYLWGLDTAFDGNLSVMELEAQQKSLTLSALYTLKGVAASGVEPSILFATQQADKVLATDNTINFNQSALYGLGRVMMNEYPFIPLSLVDMSGQTAAELQNLLSIYTQPKGKKVSEWALRAEGCFVRKLQPVNEEQDMQQSIALTPALGTDFTTLIKEEGILDSLQFRQQRRRNLAAGEVEIKVHAAGLNFKDIMNGMGLLTEEAVAGGVAGKSLGLECAGVVSAVGAGVTDIKVGDAVMAWAANSFSGYAITQQTCVAPKPASLNFAEAAGITVVYLTAYYSLNYLARMEAGEKVLIHSATGGVGLAAIQLAQKAGAEIYATAGSEEKRNYLRSLGIKYVYDSRKADFADKILQDTAGKGVDIVLNSLSGKGIIQSVRCLAPFGRFIEIGKADIYKDSKLALKRFGNNLSYFAVDLDRLMLQKPALGKRLFLELYQQFQQGVLSAGPTKTYPLEQLQEALQYISKGAHIGKVVVSMEQTAIPLLPAPELQLDGEAYYLVTGGASGFGLELGRWLVCKGARHLMLVSRSGSKSDYDHATIKEMEAKGCQVWLPKLDITDEAAVGQLATQIKKEGRVLKGIIHSAAVLEDATLANMDEARFLRVFNPKVLGAWNLHRAMLDQPMDFFISLSSISSVFGLPGQSNYSSANNFLDKLALYRQSIGLAGSSVNLGVLGMYAGMSKEGGQVLNVLANQGWLPLSLRQVTSKIENIILMQRPIRMAANLDLKRFRDFFSHLTDDSRYAHLLKADQLRAQGGSGGGTLADQILAQEAESRPGMLEGLLAAALAKILGTSAEKIATDLSISKIGLDSLMLNQLRNWIQQKLEINYPLMKVAKGPSIQELAAQLLLEIGTEEAAEKQDTYGVASDEDIEVVNQWLVRNKRIPHAVERRIFCIHPVGAGASMFSHFIYNPPAGTEVLAFQLPGRENRAQEAFYEHIDQLIPDMAAAMKPFLDKPFLILGHSFGGIVGFELIRYLRKHEGLKPEHFFVSGTIAPQLTRKWKERDVISQTAVDTNSEERLLSLMTYIDDVDFLKRILPIMRKDMPIIMSYPYQEEAIFDFPITGFAADKDEVVKAEEVSCWAAQTSASFSLEIVPGDHWFLSRNRDLILQRLAEAVQFSYVNS